jgi:hypothetical protein
MRGRLCLGSVQLPVQSAAGASSCNLSRGPPEPDDPKATKLGSTLPGQVRRPSAATTKENLRSRWHRPSKLSDHEDHQLGSTLPIGGVREPEP